MSVKTPPSLDRVREGLARIGATDAVLARSRPVVVAGTNGKGSVCAALEAILLARGERVGLFTSPHLVDPCERFRVGGRDVSPASYERANQEVLEATSDLALTDFEVHALMAVWLFCIGNTPVERMILEVGLGGTFDATNAVPHETSVVTSLGLDHQDVLGATLPEIARSKLGIVSPGSLVVHAPFPPEAAAVVAETRARVGGRWVETMPFGYRVDATGEEPRFFLGLDAVETEISLAGHRGAENCALAVTVARELGVGTREALRALGGIKWPGRMELVGRAPSGAPIYLSGDHNPQGVASLLELLPAYRRERLHLVVGVGREKDLDGVLAPLFALGDVYLTETPFRGRALADHGAWLGRATFSSPDPMAALKAATEAAAREDLVLVTGSLYLVGLVRALRKAARRDS
ncbi:MAG: bifunctional folylpolyglutamate synthase/dihydrofolate synthase [Deltaproteobacteria bacterium]|nr:bifunctional folylpolyglutamate synthase/dihydrofolate synthase [Deltaproteobacteria bacterium]